MAHFRLILILSVFLTVSCNSTKNLSLKSSASSPEAASLLQSTIDAHGGIKYETAHYAFVFRNKNYTFHNNHGKYTYTLSQEKNGVGYHNILTNDSFTRTQNGVQQALTQKQITAYTEGVNSVVYFATLPHKLNDPAVNVSHEGTTTISNKKYQVMKVTFDEEGGGRDFEDNYYYWINDSTKLIDFLAYDYKVNGGGVRFREAYNPRRVDGILFQDYINYKAPVGTALSSLPQMWERKELKELSRIDTESVRGL